MNYTLINDGIHPYSLNVTIETLAVITKLLIYIKIRVPENENDENYQREFISTVIDVEKALRGLQKNSIVNKLIENSLKTSDVELKFPIKKVKIVA